ncbi:MAG: peptide-methionine (S)-S-oxide reductase MsrA [Lysobacteraceae bacterium]
MKLTKTSARLALAPLAAFALLGVAHASPAHSAQTPMANAMAKAKTAIATFAGGCFWTMERAFDGVPGVVSAVSGYTGGKEKNPSYEDVSSSSTGHAEAVQVTYDPAKISYAKLLDIYWHDIDPTQVNGQACDTGTQYRSAIFAQDATQMKQAQAYKDTLQKSGAFNKPIAVEIDPASTFYPAEAYHQNFARTHAQHYEQYRVGCGRDRRLKAVWGASAPPSVPAI